MSVGIKVSVAFSKDHPEELFVHHKMLEQAEELFKWISSKAHMFMYRTKDQ